MTFCLKWHELAKEDFRSIKKSELKKKLNIIPVGCFVREYRRIIEKLESVKEEASDEGYFSKLQSLEDYCLKELQELESGEESMIHSFAGKAITLRVKRKLLMQRLQELNVATDEYEVPDDLTICEREALKEFKEEGQDSWFARFRDGICFSVRGEMVTRERYEQIVGKYSAEQCENLLLATNLMLADCNNEEVRTFAERAGREKALRKVTGKINERKQALTNKSLDSKAEKSEEGEEL